MLNTSVVRWNVASIITDVNFLRFLLIFSGNNPRKQLNADRSLTVINNFKSTKCQYLTKYDLLDLGHLQQLEG